MAGPGPAPASCRRSGFARTSGAKGSGRGCSRQAEREAARRGCREMQLDTHAYQAPGFYRRLGYEQIGDLPGWPAGSRRLFFRKAL